MQQSKLLLLLFLFLFLISLTTYAQDNCTIKGRITDENGKAIPYCSIYLPTMTSSSMANIDGEYAITVPCNENKIVFQSMGFESKTITNLNPENKELNIQLKTAIYQLKAVDIDPNSEDIAYNYIRKATAMSEYYKKQITAYKASLYIRSFFDVKEIPWLVEKLADEEDIKEMKTGNITETLAEYSYKRPNEVREKIIATKSGSLDTSRLGSGFINLNFYNLGGTGIVNPLSRNAFQVYEYEHIDTYYEEGQGVHKIKIIPRRKGDDLMKGFIYINDRLWNINNIDVSFDQPLARIKYKQQYAEIHPNVWMPINHKIKVAVKAVGFNADINYLATLNEIEVETDSIIDAKIEKHKSKRSQAQSPQKETLEKTTSTSESKKKDTEHKVQALLQKEKLSKTESLKLIRLIKKQERENEEKGEERLEHDQNHKIDYEDSAFVMSDSLWDKRRDIPLSQVETSIYEARDSLNKVENGDTVINEPASALNRILYFNGTINSKNKNIRFRPKGLSIGLSGGFNTVDGFVVRKDILDFEWNNRKGKYYVFTPWLGYAAARKTFLGGLKYESQYNTKKRAGFFGSVGKDSWDFNRSNPFGEVLNTISSLFFEQNYKKMFQTDYINFGHQFDIVNGLQIKTSISYENRQQLFNNSDKLFIEWEDRTYTNNIPSHIDITNIYNSSHEYYSSKIADHEALIAEASISYTIKQHYRIRKQKKELLYSYHPSFQLNYKKGIKNSTLSDVDYDLLSFSVSQNFPFRLIDKISYHIETGKFLNNNSVFFADYKNFTTNPFFIRGNTQTSSFGILDDYSSSTNDYYFEGHLTVLNDHILLKYLPLLNRTNWKEELSFNYLYTERQEHYTELGYSLNNIFLLLNVGAYAGFVDGKYSNWGLRISTNLTNAR